MGSSDNYAMLSCSQKKLRDMEVYNLLEWVIIKSCNYYGIWHEQGITGELWFFSMTDPM